MNTDTSKISNAQRALRPYIQKVATGPEYSKDLSFDEAYQATKIILDNTADPVQTAVLLIGLRMKRETNDENGGILKAIMECSEQTTAEVDEVLDLADPYDGYVRSVPLTPFVPAVLAACGVACVSHGVKKLGPKFGATHHSVLQAAGLPVNKTCQQAAQAIADKAMGWAYVDQAQFCPAMHRLIELRTRIIKRPALTTVEVLTGPIRGRHKTHLYTGYVHKAYPPVYKYLSEVAGFDSVILMRGVEGGVLPSLRQTNTAYLCTDNTKPVTSYEYDPKTIGIEESQRAVPVSDDFPKVKIKMDAIASDIDIDKLSSVAAETGLEVLKGQSKGSLGLAHNAVLWPASIALAHVKKLPLKTAAEQVRQVIQSGKALAHFQAYAG